MIDANDVLADPEGMLSSLCEALGIAVGPRNAAAGRRDAARQTASGRRTGTMQSRRAPASARPRRPRRTSRRCPPARRAVPALITSGLQRIGSPPGEADGRIQLPLGPALDHPGAGDCAGLAGISCAPARAGKDSGRSCAPRSGAGSSCCSPRRPGGRASDLNASATSGTFSISP